MFMLLAELLLLVLLFSLLIVTVDGVIVGLSCVNDILSRPGRYDSKNASTAESLGLYVQYPLSF